MKQGMAERKGITSESLPHKPNHTEPCLPFDRGWAPEPPRGVMKGASHPAFPGSSLMPIRPAFFHFYTAYLLPFWYAFTLSQNTRFSSYYEHPQPSRLQGQEPHTPFLLFMSIHSHPQGRLRPSILKEGRERPSTRTNSISFWDWEAPVFGFIGMGFHSLGSTGIRKPNQPPPIPRKSNHSFTPNSGIVSYTKPSLDRFLYWVCLDVSCHRKSNWTYRLITRAMNHTRKYITIP